MRPDPSGTAPRVVVVVPALNEERYIERCIRGLLGDGVAAAGVRLVVVDGRSHDLTRDIVRSLMPQYPGLELLDNPRRLQACAINLVARREAGRCDVLVRCDAHSVYPPRFILDVARSLVRHDAQSLVVPMDAIGEASFQRATVGVVDTPLGSGGAPHRGGRTSGYVDHGHHAGFRLEWFLRIGGYDETFSHNEDAEYDSRLRAAGGRIYLDAAIRIGYFPRRTPAALWAQYAAYGRGRARNHAKNRSRPALRQVVPVANLALLLASAAAAPFTAYGLAWPGLYLAVLASASLAMVLRHRAPEGLWSGVALAVMHTAWAAGFLLQIGKAWPASRPASAALPGNRIDGIEESSR